MPSSRARMLLDDAQAFLSATLLVAIGLHLLASARLLVGGVPGLAFLLRYATDWPLGACLMVANVPFYVLAWRALGWRFVAKTLAAMTLLALLVELVRPALVVQAIHPLLAALGGGLLVGVGILILLRHRGSLGGVGVLAVVMQRRRGWNVGAVQLLLDTAILAAGSMLVSGRQLAYSVLAAVALNLVLYWNHRPTATPSPT
jgi:uncharacterized membrane-anchored protein YitT (DUF2179 family)